ncbi:hypothetical protein ALI144C_36230 [Actinosynnema sp. ALI-1.44]|uniref:hypothetical protein n=1 Tax=Actinosynnema sp. ALI-1.44 TaxID=1933779 RepID=UPI00097C2470|nr:hypothetical protein [Actinosynnema sp. ALI-1.44]ONI76136.1 hypothetical protein ALI144C_36230 [Actinosynnema sp. ALI-1.44]
MFCRTVLVLGTALVLSACTQVTEGTATADGPDELPDPACPGKTASSVLHSSEQALRALLPTEARQSGLDRPDISVKSREQMIDLEHGNEETRAVFAKAEFGMQAQVVFRGDDATAGRAEDPFETYTVQWFGSATGACDFLVRERRSAKPGEIGPGVPEIPGSYRYETYYYASKGRFLVWVNSRGTETAAMLTLLYDRLP